MHYFCSDEEIFLTPWGNLPTLKELLLERVHEEGTNKTTEYQFFKIG